MYYDDDQMLMLSGIQTQLTCKLLSVAVSPSM